MSSQSRRRGGRRIVGGVASRTLLATGNFTIDGVYYTDHNSSTLAGMTFGQTLTHRYVGGQLRFLATAANGSSGGHVIFRLVEFTLPAGGFGGTVTDAQITNYWEDVFQAPKGAEHHCVHWDEGKGGVWLAQSEDYPDDGAPGSDTGIYRTSAISFAEMSDGTPGTLTNRVGQYGFEGVGYRAVYGGIRETPARWQSEFGFGPYFVPAGGYSSRTAQGLVPSFGPLFVSVPDPTTYTSPTAEIPAADFDILADFRSGTVNGSDDWYEDYTGPGYEPAFDCGVRLTDLKNYLATDPDDLMGNNPIISASTVDTNGTAVTRAGGDSFQAWNAGYSWAVDGVTVSSGTLACTINGVSYDIAAYVDADHLTLAASAGVQTGVAYAGPSNKPVMDPPDSAQWVSPAPDGANRWTWVDSYNGGCALIEGDTKYGVVAVGAFIGGKCYYGGSTINFESSASELHLFDPAELAEVKAGTRDPWAVRPYAMIDLTAALRAALGDDPKVGQGTGGFALNGNVSSATWDGTAKKLWLWLTGLGNGYKCALVCLAVDC